MGPAWTRPWQLQYRVQDVLADFLARVSLWLIPTQGVGTPEPCTTQDKGSASTSPSFIMPDVMDCGKNNNTCLLAFFVCYSGHFAPRLGVSGLPLTNVSILIHQNTCIFTTSAYCWVIFLSCWRRPTLPPQLILFCQLNPTMTDLILSMEE